MRNKFGQSIPSAVVQSGDGKLSWLRDLESLSIGELIELYAYSEAIVETVREPLVILDKDLRVKTVNKSFLNTFKATKKATYGKYIYQVNNGEWDIPDLRKLLEDILPQNSFFNDFAVTHKFRKVGERIMLLNARRIVLEENKTGLILLAMEDITERRTLEAQKDAFVSIISHELKTPLTSMKIFSQAAEKRLKVKEDTENSLLLKKITQQINKLTDIVDELLSAGRIEAGELRLYKRKIDLEKLIKKIVADFQLTTVKHTISREGRIGRKVFSDAHRIEQVLTNLLTNAVKYSPNSDKIIVRCGMKNDQALVSVQDFGLGIDKRDQAHVFEKFYRTKKKHEESIAGFGLGLYISHQIIQKLGGNMWVESIKVRVQHSFSHFRWSKEERRVFYNHIVVKSCSLWENWQKSY